MEENVPMPVPTDTVCLRNLARMLPLVQEGIGDTSLRSVNANLDVYLSPKFGDSHVVTSVWLNPLNPSAAAIAEPSSGASLGASPV